MKRIFTLLSFCFILNILSAQTASDWTVTSTHEEQISLYDLLDDGKTVVIDIFFVDCPPCNGIAPFMQDKYTEWGSGANDVEFISLTDVDLNSKILGYEDMHGLTFPAAGTDGGGTEAVSPYKSGEFGQFWGYPTIVVIAPDRSVQFDIWGDNYENTMELLEVALVNTGAEKPTSSVFEAQEGFNLNVYPNPVVQNLQVDFSLDATTNVNVQIMDATGQLVSLENIGNLTAGNQSVSLDFSAFSNGVYFIHLRDNLTTLASFSIVK